MSLEILKVITNFEKKFIWRWRKTHKVCSKLALFVQNLLKFFNLIKLY